MPTLSVVIGETESIAKEKAEFLDSLIDPELVMASGSTCSASISAPSRPPRKPRAPPATRASRARATA